jgi:hypothetical protein
MEEKIKELKIIKDKIAILLLKQKEEKQKFFETVIEPLSKKISQLEVTKSDLQKEVETEVLQKFNETKEKKYYGGVGVKEFKEILYDYNVAFNWAKEKDMFLLLDKKEFEKAASGLKLDFVKFDKKPKVTWPKEIKLEE